MTKIELDDLWDKAFKQAQAEGEEYTRYHFAALVQAHEREACAKLCEEQYEYYGHDHIFAKAIRARK